MQLTKRFSNSLSAFKKPLLVLLGVLLILYYWNYEFIPTTASALNYTLEANGLKESFVEFIQNSFLYG